MHPFNWMILPVIVVLGIAATLYVDFGAQSAGPTEDADYRVVVPAAARDATAPAIPTETSVPPISTPPADKPIASFEAVFPGAVFDDLVVELMPVPGTDTMVAVVKSGEIVTFPVGGPFVSPVTALDIKGRVLNDDELGLLSFAFDPGFGSNGFVYVYYSASVDPNRTILSRMHATTGGGLVVDPATELIILEFPQPAEYYNGGRIEFGPDGMLYLGLGDGGVESNGQDINNNLLGSVIRIDVSGASAQQPYTVPLGNPFVGTPGARGETWATGLRNPWRMTFDPATGELWLADVGEDAREEVNVIEPGLNYGWNLREGTICHQDGPSCNSTGMTDPVAEYTRASGCSIAGGFVYRGQDVPSLVGYYVYGDLCSGNVWALNAAKAVAGMSPVPVLLWADGPAPIAFGQDGAGEIYLLTIEAEIFKVVP